MKIALVSEHASPLAVLGGVEAGGQNVHVAQLARELGRRGAEVVVFTRRDDPGLPPRVPFAPNVTVEHVDAGPHERIPNVIDVLWPYMGVFADGLARAWARERPDVVHAHFWMSGAASLAAAAPFELPVVQTFHALGVVKRRHQGASDTSPRARIPTEAAIVHGAHRIVAQCSDELFELVRLGADMDKLRVIPSGVDTAAFCPDGHCQPRGEAFRVVVVSRLVPRKGIGNVIEALAGVRGAELLVAGGPDRARLADDAEAERLLELARRTGVADRVELLGRVDDVPALLRSADAVVCAPWYEPFGIVPLEAMACGVPVVAATVGGLIDTVVDGVTGIHVPPRRPDRIAHALRALQASADLRRALGGAGAERVRRSFTWRRSADALLDLYAGALSRRSLIPAEARR